MAIPDYTLVEDALSKVLTQYRESDNFLLLIQTYLREAEIVYQAIEDIPLFFDIETAVGEQLTFIGKRLGWGRCHCICQPRTLIGIECEGYTERYKIGGLCNDQATWEDCGAIINSEICIDDDETYRKFLKVRCYQMLQRYSLEDANTCCDIFWGSTAFVLKHGNGRIVIATGRDLTEEEFTLLQLCPRVFPVALGIDVYFHLNRVPVAGIGEGWDGVCESEEGPLLLTDENGDHIQDESGNNIDLELIFRGGELMCEYDPRPYDCAEPISSI